MSSQRGKHIFENSRFLSQDELEKYMNGEVAREEQYVIEQKISANQLNAEAVEGYEQNPSAIASIDKYKEQFSQSASGAPDWLRAPVIVPALAILVGFIIITLIAINYLQRRHDIAKLPVAEQSEAVSPSIETSYLNAFEKDQQEIVSAEEIAVEKQISYEVALENQAEQKVSVEIPIETSAEEVPEKKEFKGSITALEPEQVVSGVPDQKVRKSSSKSNVILRYYNDLKTVDYSKFYDQDLLVPGFDLSGVEAKYEYKAQNEEWNRYGPNTTYISYSKYLGQAMEKFSNNNFKGALQDYRVVLEQFPEDQNALFYGGLCYFNLGMGNKAIRFFTQVEKSYINTFYEEAKWYKALSYEQLGDEKNLETTLKEIIEEEGFYAKRAKEKLGRQ